MLIASRTSTAPRHQPTRHDSVAGRLNPGPGKESYLRYTEPLQELEKSKRLSFFIASLYASDKVRLPKKEKRWTQLTREEARETNGIGRKGWRKTRNGRRA